MPGSVIVGSARTPIGKLSGALTGFSATELGGIAIKAALERAGVDAEQVDYVLMGQVLLGGAGQITARQAGERPSRWDAQQSCPTCRRCPESAVRRTRASATAAEELTLGVRRGDGDGPLVGGCGLAGSAEAAKEVGSGRVEGVVVDEVQLAYQGQRRSGPGSAPIAIARLSATTGVGATSSNWP